jgi:hypothetical protein
MPLRNDEYLARRQPHKEGLMAMNDPTAAPDGRTRLAYILGVPLAPDVERQWPQMGEVVRGSKIIGEIEGNFPELTLEVGRRLHLDNDIIVVEWTCNYGDGRLYRNVTIADLGVRSSQVQAREMAAVRRSIKGSLCPNRYSSPADWISLSSSGNLQSSRSVRHSILRTR